MAKVRTASGKEFNIDHCALAIYGSMQMLYIEFVGYSMAEVFQTFSDKNETCSISGIEDDVVEKTYDEYILLKEIFEVPNTENHIRIRLEREYTVERFG